MPQRALEQRDHRQRGGGEEQVPGHRVRQQDADAHLGDVVVEQLAVEDAARIRTPGSAPLTAVMMIVLFTADVTTAPNATRTVHRRSRPTPAAHCPRRQVGQAAEGQRRGAVGQPDRGAAEYTPVQRRPAHPPLRQDEPGNRGEQREQRGQQDRDRELPHPWTSLLMPCCSLARRLHSTAIAVQASRTANRIRSCPRNVVSGAVTPTAARLAAMTARTKTLSQRGSLQIAQSLTAFTRAGGDGPAPSAPSLCKLPPRHRVTGSPMCNARSIVPHHRSGERKT